MAIAYRSNSSAHELSAYSLEINKPSGLANGDIMLLFVRTQIGSTYISGWDFLTDEYMNSRGINVYSRYVTNAAGEPSYYSVQSYGGAVNMEGVIAAYSGASPTVVDAQAWHAYSEWQTSTTFPDVAVRASGWSVGFVGCGNDTGGISFNTPSGFTERRDEAIDPGSLQLIDHSAYGSNGYSGTINSSTNGVDAQYLLSAHVSLAIANTAPNAPTLNSPTGGVTINRGQQQRFLWTFSDPDTGDTQSAFDLQYKITTDSAWTNVSQQTPSQFRDFAINTFSAGNYEWQVRTTDNGGLRGNWSASAYFTAADPPAGPTITAPGVNESVGSTYEVTWSVSNQTSYQLRTVADNAGSPNTGTVYTDSGEVVSQAARAAVASFAVNSRYEHVQLRVSYGGIWSDWATDRVLVSFTPPSAPTFTLVSQAALGAIDVGITNSNPGGGVPNTVYNDIWVDDGLGEGLTLRKTAQSPNSTWRYYTPVSGRLYESTTIRVMAMGDNGISTWSV